MSKGKPYWFDAIYTMCQREAERIGGTVEISPLGWPAVKKRK